MKYPEKKNKKTKTTNRKTELKKTTTATTTNNTLTHNHKQLILSTYFTQKIISGYCSDDIYRKGLHPLPPWHHNYMMSYNKYERGRQHLNGGHQKITYKKKKKNKHKNNTYLTAYPK